MKRLTARQTVGAAVAVLAAKGLSAQQQPLSGRTWITDVTIVSPERLDQVVTGSVLIENGRIARVERDTVVTDTAGAIMVSGRGKYLIPGLIDSHVHLTLVPGMSADQMARHPGIVSRYFRQLPRSYLYYGYTTVVDLGVAVDHERLDTFRHAPVRPDLYTCGDALVLANGYPTVFYPPDMRYKLFPNLIVDPRLPASTRSEFDRRRHTPSAAVAAVRRAGGICVKTFYERGFGPNANLPVIGRELLAEIRAAAARARLPLILHANSFEAQTVGVDDHVDVLAHGMWEWGSFDTSATLPRPITDLLDRIAQEHIGYQPTIQVVAAQRAYFDSAYLRMPAIAKVVPAAMLAWFNTADGRSFRDTLTGGTARTDAAMLAAFERNPFRRVRQVVGYLADNDADFLFGTDTPSMPSYGNLPGLNGYLEMRQLSKAGLSMKQILMAATINNARILQIDSLVGTIEAGKAANLILLDASPLESVDAYDDILTVWVHGKAIRRETLACVN